MIECRKCRFWKPDSRDRNENEGTCRLKAPVVLRSAQQCSQTVWPSTKIYDGCAEGVAK